MGNLKTHRDLDVWREGIELVVKVYEIVQKFPNEERYGLVDIGLGNQETAYIQRPDPCEYTRGTVVFEIKRLGDE
ncbi:MAG: hypothetical protein DRG83_00520 [Deltaproteobacteria bacterium]|nr:MAG: hypothetical protein DRG83_00520 [Deltaproteobacteria bacterium]